MRRVPSAAPDTPPPLPLRGRVRGGARVRFPTCRRCRGDAAHGGGGGGRDPDPHPDPPPPTPPTPTPVPGRARPAQPPPPAQPKSREFFRSQRKESEGSLDCPNLEFEYGDTDNHGSELAELYSYTEEPELSTNRRCFEEDFHTQVQGRRWLELAGAQQKAYIMHLLDGLEVVNRDRRLKVARAILYLAQGVFGDCDNEGDVLYWSRHNSFLLYQLGTFTAFLELLNMEIDNSQACSSALRKPAISLADSTELRVLLSVMYLLVENIRVEREADPSEWKTSRETFRMELSFPVHTEEPFALLLFTMVTKFCSGHAPHFPMKKVLLLLWKVLLFTLGGFEALQMMKVRKREELGLPPLPEDSIQVMSSMRAASPPACSLELLEQQQQQQQKQRGHRSRRHLVSEPEEQRISSCHDGKLSGGNGILTG
ncbi:striatin-interacting protein 2-like [Calypte anna]|uniref:striatin-interacting protein 2-like n=1 Tax=Calypte anna TaxID=9244 RepID=UPI0011C37C91|nr:striatin-interacting protein 2-like [Calypte anna]